MARAARRGGGRPVRLLARGDFDLVAVGRPLIADPDWPRKVAAGRFDDVVPITPAHLLGIGYPAVRSADGSGRMSRRRRVRRSEATRQPPGVRT